MYSYTTFNWETAAIGIIILALTITAGAIVAAVFYTITLQKTLNSCAPENRQMEGGMVWLNWIPLFGLGWQFYVYIKIQESLKLEFESRGIEPDDSNFGYGIGLAYGVCNCVAVIPYLFPVGIASFVLWIIYWVKINGYYQLLNEESSN